MNGIDSAVILARVSSKSQEDEGYSLDSQLKLLHGYCENKDLRVIKIFKITETASKQQSRKVFQELMRYITSNKIYHLAVEKTDRLTRNMRDAVAIDDWLEADSQRMLHAVKENLQLHKASKSDVKFMWNIHLAVAKKYTDNLREEAMKGWAEKLAQGWMPSPPPIGYKTAVRYGKRIHIIDSSTAPLVRKAFNSYLEPGQSIATIQELMESIGLVTSRGKPFQKSHVQKILNNPFYMGTIRFNGQEYPGAHEPILSEELFKAVQLKMTGGKPVKFRKHNPLLKNMMLCEYCGKVVTWQQQKGRYYGACQRNLADCKKRKFIREDTVEDQVKVMLRRLVCPSPLIMNWVTESIGDELKNSTKNHEAVVNGILARIERIEKMDEILYDDKLSGLITPEKYQFKHEGFMTDLIELKGQIKGADEEVKRKYKEGISIIELSQEAAEIYESQDIEEKRTILTKLFKKMLVKERLVSVKYTKLANAIATKSEETRVYMRTLNLDNRTAKKDPINRGLTEHEIALRSIWQGWRDSNPRPLVLETNALAI